MSIAGNHAADRHDDTADDDDDTGRELPPLAIGRAERRLQVRAYNCWAGLLGERQVPSITGLTPQTLALFGDHAVLLDFTDGDDPAISHLGAALAQECGHAAAIRCLSDVPADSLLARITGEYPQVLATQSPTGFEAEFVNARGATILYRGMLLPFAGEAGGIDHVLGVLNWKEVADAQVAHELERQIGRSLERSASSPEPLPITWADGPDRIDRRLVASDPLLDEFGYEAGVPEPGLLDEALLQRLRGIEGPRDLLAQGDEFTLAVMRRTEDGGVVVVGEVRDAALLDRAARQLLG